MSTAKKTRKLKLKVFLMDEFLDLFTVLTLSVILICVTILVSGLLEKFFNSPRREEVSPLYKRRWGRNLFF